MTPLMVDIMELEGRGDLVRAGVACDDLDSLSHVRLIGLFRRVYRDPEMMAQIKWVLEQRIISQEDSEALE